MSNAYIKTILLATCSTILVIAIILFPQQAFEASLRGLNIWWEVVFPAQLPFFIAAELLMGFGVVHFLGVLLEPMMKPLFRVPGTGGFVMAMGLSSGYPMGAKLSVSLREQGLITRSEGERLVALTTTSGPLFMIGAVAVGFFQDVRLGVIIALAHYSSAVCVGLIMRFHDYKEKVTVHKPEQGNIFYRALQAMHRARLKDNRTLGTLMGDAVMSSIQTQLMIGGFIIIFSVLLKIFDLIGLQFILGSILSLIFTLFGFPAELSSPLMYGLFEITLGSQQSSQLSDSIPLVIKVAVAGAIIAWSGLSVHAQVASMLAKTDIRYTPYLFSRMLHALLAAIFTFLIWRILGNKLLVEDATVIKLGQIIHWQPVWDRYIYFSCSLFLLILLLTCIYTLINWAKLKAQR